MQARMCVSFFPFISGNNTNVDKSIIPFLSKFVNWLMPVMLHLCYERVLLEYGSSLSVSEMSR